MDQANNGSQYVWFQELGEFLSIFHIWVAMTTHVNRKWQTSNPVTRTYTHFYRMDTMILHSNQTLHFGCSSWFVQTAHLVTTSDNATREQPTMQLWLQKGEQVRASLANRNWDRGAHANKPAMALAHWLHMKTVMWSVKHKSKIIYVRQRFLQHFWRLDAWSMIETYM